MNRIPIVSSRILSIGWENNTLEVQFKGGNVYQYFGVAEAEYKMLVNSASPGKAITQIQKTHNYRPVI